MNQSLERGGEALSYHVETRPESLIKAINLAGKIAVGVNSEQGQGASNIENRPYQTEAWDAIYTARDDGEGSALVHLATGLGKTTVGVVDALRFAGKFMEMHNRPPKIMFAVHQNSILEQAAERFAAFAPALTQGQCAEGIKDLDQDITFATMQSLYQNLDSIDPEHFDYIIYDEAHHAQAETFKEVVGHLKPSFQLALTATPDRMDEERIEELFGEPVYVKTLAEAMSEGYLADIDYHIVFDDAVRQAMDGQFSPKTLVEIRELLKNESRNEEIAAQIMDEVEKIGLKDTKTIIFCQDTEQANQMAELLGGSAYHSGVDKTSRRDALNKFRTGLLHVITTRDMFNEGVDIPDARLLVFLRSTASRTVFEQQLGRGLRKNANKVSVSVLDFVANIERLGQVKELVDQITEHRTQQNQQRGLADYEGVDVIDAETGLKIRSAHTDFDFDKISIDLIEKISEIKSKSPFNDFSNEELIELALEISPDAPLTQVQLNNLGQSGEFLSRKLVETRFGSIKLFQSACGFEVKKHSNKQTKLSDDELIALALKISPDRPLGQHRIIELSKRGEFTSTGTIQKRFGSLKNFQNACGFEKKTYSREELINIAHNLSPSEPLTRKLMEELYESGDFPVYPKKITQLFGSIQKFYEACGHKPAKLSDADVVEMALNVSPTKPLSSGEIQELSKQKKMPSVGTIYKRFGSLKDFHSACGF